MNRSRRAALALAGLSLAAPLLPGLARAQAAPTKLRVGYIAAAADFIPIFVAADKGMFSAQGLDVTLQPVQYATNVPAALVAGSIEIGMTTAPIFAQAREGGLDLLAISGLTLETRANPQLSLLVRKDSPIRTAKDLEGHKVAVPGLNSLFDTALMRWIDTHGGDHRKVTFVEVPMPQLTDVLRGGSVDAIAVIDPFRARSLGDGSAVKVADFLAELHDPSPLAFWIARAEWARANRPVVEAYRRALAAALVFIAANPDETRDIGAKYLHGQRVARFSTWSLALTPEDLVYEAGIETELGLLREKFDAQAAVLK